MSQWYNKNRDKKSLFKHARVELVVVLVRKTHTHTAHFWDCSWLRTQVMNSPIRFTHVQFSVSVSIKTKRTLYTHTEQNSMQLNPLYLSFLSGDVPLLSDAWSIKDLFCPLFLLQSKRLSLFTLKRLMFKNLILAVLRQCCAFWSPANYHQN